MEVFQLTLDAPRAASREKISLLDRFFVYKKLII